MKVRIISLTKSLVQKELGEELSAEELIVYMARISNPSNQLNTATSDRLLRYLIKHKHWSPFDMVNLCVEVTTSRAIAHQILRHWSIKPQEFSQRYAEATNYEPVQLRLAADSNRQSSSVEIAIVDHDAEEDNIQMKDIASEKQADLASRVLKHIENSDQLYKDLIKEGIAKECARMILPLTTSTTLCLNGSIRSWIHYLEQRTDLHAQLEHRQVAEEIKSVFASHFPHVIKAIEEND